LGFIFSPNERGVEFYMEYNDFEQSQRLNRWRYWYLVEANGLYKPNVYTGSSFQMGGFWFTRKFFAFGFNSRCLIIARSRLGIIRGREGYIDKSGFDYASYGLTDSAVTFGLRNRNTVTNSLTLNYIFTNRMSLDLRVRHYWDSVGYDDYLSLREDGSLTSIDFDGLDDDGNSIYTINNNFFNVDLNYYWRFLPGSDIIFSYKNNAFANELLHGYADNLSSLFQERSNHFYSLKVLYFLDVNRTVQSLSERR